MAKFIIGALAGVALVLAALAWIGPPSVPQQVDAPATAAEENLPPGPDLAEIDALRDRVYAQDIAAVEAVFQTIRSDSRAAQARQRDLFGLFNELHPAVDRFTQSWLAAAPGSAAAMTARASQLYSLGWTWRGDGLASTVSAPALQAFRNAHAEGLALAQAATEIDPALVAASDRVLDLSYTIGQRALVIPEVARIMAISPNRATLVEAGKTLAPKWGGSLAEIAEMCSRFANDVKNQPGYDATICRIDGAMAAGLLPGPELDAALAMLKANPSPLLDQWRRDGPVVAGDTPSARIKTLEKIKATRPLGVQEAQIHDQDAAQLAVLAGTKLPLEHPAAVSRWHIEARLWADRDPGAYSTLQRYERAKADDRALNGVSYDAADLERRHIAHLQIAPYTADAWRWLGVFYAQTSPDVLAGLERAQPYLANALATSNHRKDMLALTFSMKFSEVFTAMANATPHPDTARFHRVVQCPMVRELRLLLALCAADGQDFTTCTGSLPYEASNMEGFINEVADAGACPFETTAPLEQLAYEFQDVPLSLP